ncbi:unnamed protein product [Pseudo-nitzschia multistriata]|uniref:Uncharacterized protein n=1 Tax=Pseudo-nitzschia multistriata TaxID=183589 RepID=A0A448YYL8_9STRA|nr:unnamed protein product [Pseudo-nitzschia multistriata]
MNIDIDSSVDSDDDQGNELFTPIRGRRTSLVQYFSPTPSRSVETDETASETGVPNTLPKLQDTSWLGARMSPIPRDGDNLLRNHKSSSSNKNISNANNKATVEGDEDNSNSNDTVGVSYRSGLTQTSVSGASCGAATEALFLRLDDTDDSNQGHLRYFDRPKVATHNVVGLGSPSSSRGYVRPRPTLLLHPRTTATTRTHGTSQSHRQQQQYQQSRRRRRLWNPFERVFRAFRPKHTSNKSMFLVTGTTALVLFCIGLHDAFLGYLAMRRGISASSRSGFAWSLPWIGPSARSLLRFGAFCPERLVLCYSSSVYSWHCYWRSVASLFVVTSLVEWLVLVWVWTRYLPTSWNVSPSNSSPWQLSWLIVYLLSAFTGQLWMVVFDIGYLNSGSSYGKYNDYNPYSSDLSMVPAASGCAGWATAGVLCAVGIQRPNRRFPCFLSAIVLVLLHQCQSTGSVVGCSSASFFGWAFSGMWSTTASHYARGHGRGSYSTTDHQDLLDLDFSHRNVNNNTYHEMQVNNDHVGNNSSSSYNESDYRCNLWNGFAAGIVFLLWLLPILFFLYR